jgi:PTH2 family peptidyl-tRNA hydrolase
MSKKNKFENEDDSSFSKKNFRLSAESNDSAKKDIAMYIFINNDLHMEKGKIAGQCSHATQHIIEEIIFQHYNCKKEESLQIKDDYINWKKHHGSAKIVLKATQSDLEELMNLPNSTYVRDAGKTQIAPNSLTCVAFYPCKKSELIHITQKYKLL